MKFAGLFVVFAIGIAVADGSRSLSANDPR